MRYTLTAFLLAAVMAGCNKDKFQTKPQIRLLSVSSMVIPVNSDMLIRMEFTDKEGDIDDSLFVRKVRLNLRTRDTVRDSFRLKVPDFPDRSKGEIELRLSYQNLISAADPPTVPGTNPPQREADTLNLRFLLRDKAGNRSDTLTIERIVVRRS